MRCARLVLVLACALAGACSAVDDFTAFRFVDDGGASDLFGVGGDLAGSVVGDPCNVGGCSDGLTCFGAVGNASFPGGLCSRPCGGGTSCPARSSCAQIDGTALCLQSCNPTVGIDCRAGWSCCDGQRVVLGPGLCAPSSSNFCGG